MPLKTREGVAEAPIDPGARTLCDPCQSRGDWKPCRRIVPWKPFPFEVPEIFTRSPALKPSTLTPPRSVPRSGSSTALSRNSTTCRIGRRPDLAAGAQVGLCEVLLVGLPESELDRLVAVPLAGPHGRHGAGPRLQHGHPRDLPVLRKTWVIPSFLARMAGIGRRLGGIGWLGREAQVARRISMSTPAGRWSRRCNESTVFGVGWWMSIRRLCVRISKCSRESCP